jgi:hypothetical protein
MAHLHMGRLHIWAVTYILNINFYIILYYFNIIIINIIHKFILYFYILHSILTPKHQTKNATTTTVYSHL